MKNTVHSIMNVGDSTVLRVTTNESKDIINITVNIQKNKTEVVIENAHPTRGLKIKSNE